MYKISGKQCLKARALLKWNIHDLANRLNNILPRRIDSFEKGVIQLYRWENDAICSVLEDVGIVLTSDFEVHLKEDRAEENSAGLGIQGIGARIVLDADLSIISDTSDGKAGGLFPKMKPGEEEKPMEEKKQPTVK